MNVAREVDLDAAIQGQISKVVHQDASVTERDLNELDKKISAIVAGCRKTDSKAQSQASQDARSSYSKKSFAPSKSASDGMMNFDPDQQIITANQGKVIGMTSS